ncbi:bifunctional (p)ppGpp synthetase/guanosine-3',5'-bis(diphosphate) 3'-pyrophosphohydrolase [Thiomicrorhabdus sp.]|uniref:RelA/SpoT family protein n=1 Tax=Thiomicrorhabdus sp. TaxID=2039724 RepID=UPI0029C68045|nr:bifunctional (p)ppGpp synthetase/guanosine-3',5'-bis(diphosphate) 3'-pyrophosphohydrolase [Thiomicrorhabdus sp.]
MTIQALYKQLFGDIQRDAKQVERYTKACELAIEAQGLPEKSIVRSTDVAIILADLNIDEETLIATLLSDGNLEEAYSDDFIRSGFGASTSDLVHGIRKLNQFKEFDVERKSDAVQNERLRQMLLAMTSDIRIMIVKLAYRVARLRHLKYEDENVRHLIAAETELIFSPLANRLGIAQLKWELEDLSFRYLHPQKYKEIASLLQSKRTERELYIQDMIKQLEALLAKEGIKAKISGRPKHIYSIWKKMQRKNLTIDELFDLRAVRIYVDSVTTCYEALGLIHSSWNYVKQEFDDYIATPKENGYQSIHTVIIGPGGQTVEIQIRTHEMHHNAEYGIAAHWRYKEGGKSYDSNLERSIANVRQLLENSDDPDVFKEISTELQSQNIFVMTPTNQIITLRQGSTPLDFAYNIHTELGHSCRGAKVNGRIQPLSHLLKTGDKVEILSVKNGQPSRNWLNPNLGYLTSSSARNKVRSWFNKQNRSENIEAGEALYHREIKRLHAEEIHIQDVVARFKLENSEILFEELGKGRINDRQLNNAIQTLLKPEKHTFEQTQRSIRFREPSLEGDMRSARAYVVGASNLATNLAPCCTPHPGDDIVGYVTRGRGITVHTRECANVLNLNHNEQQRLIEVVWDKELAENPLYDAELHVLAFDRKGLLRDVMSVLTDMDINLIASQTETDQQERSVTMKLTIELSAGMNLGDLLDRIEVVQNVESASIKTL